MGRFLDPLILQSTGQMSHGRPIRRVMHQFRYVYGDEVAGGQVYVPEGFLTDLASVPRLFWRIMPPWLGEESSVIHDFLYTEQHMDRAMADAVFRHSLNDCNVDTFRRWLMWAAVRLFGGPLYARRDADGAKRQMRKKRSINAKGIQDGRENGR